MITILDKDTCGTEQYNRKLDYVRYESGHRSDANDIETIILYMSHILFYVETNEGYIIIKDILVNKQIW